MTFPENVNETILSDFCRDELEGHKEHWRVQLKSK